MLMALAMIAQSIATAAMPTFSAQVARNQIEGMRASLSATLRGVIFLAIPATVGLILLREPIVEMLYQRGEFTQQYARMTAWALLWFAAGLVGHSLLEILSRAFYALHDTKTPVVVGAIAMGLNIVFSFVFAYLFSIIGWMPLGGLALANSLATALEAVALFLIMRRRLNGIGGTAIARGFLVAAITSGMMGVVLLLWIRASVDFNVWLVGLGGILFGGLAYGLCLIALRVPEVRTMLLYIQHRISR
jgi:putative peptidoglycan lipid II flippase